MTYERMQYKSKDLVNKTLTKAEKIYKVYKYENDESLTELISTLGDTITAIKALRDDLKLVKEINGSLA